MTAPSATPRPPAPTLPLVVSLMTTGAAIAVSVIVVTADRLIRRWSPIG